MLKIKKNYVILFTFVNASLIKSHRTPTALAAFSFFNVKVIHEIVESTLKNLAKTRLISCVGYYWFNIYELNSNETSDQRSIKTMEVKYLYSINWKFRCKHHDKFIDNIQISLLMEFVYRVLKAVQPCVFILHEMKI